MREHAPILAVENQESDVLLLRMAFKNLGMANPLIIVHDGQAAVAYLSGCPPYNDRAQHPLPCLVLLDVRMPQMNGFQLLQWLRARLDLERVPAVVLSSSTDQSDIEKALELGARDYLIKPLGFTRLTELVRQLSERWILQSH